MKMCYNRVCELFSLEKWNKRDFDFKLRNAMKIIFVLKVSLVAKNSSIEEYFYLIGSNAEGGEGMYEWTTLKLNDGRLHPTTNITKLLLVRPSVHTKYISNRCNSHKL